jgi:hypothetical protein
MPNGKKPLTRKRHGPTDVIGSTGGVHHPGQSNLWRILGIAVTPRAGHIDLPALTEEPNVCWT